MNDQGDDTGSLGTPRVLPQREAIEMVSMPLKVEGDDVSDMISVVIPAYNEAKRLPSYLGEVRSYFGGRDAAHLEVIVVDDGSRDNTRGVVERAAKFWPIVSIIRHECNRGKGAAIRTGIEAARGNVVLITDADGAGCIRDEAKLRRAIDGGAEIAVGSRFLGTSGVTVKRSLHRSLCGLAFAALVRRMFSLPIRDTQCGFKMLTREGALRLLPLCRESGYLFDVELLAFAYALGYSIAEVPISWRDVPGSKLRILREAWMIIPGLLRVRRRVEAARNPGAPASRHDGRYPARTDDPTIAARSAGAIPKYGILFQALCWGALLTLAALQCRSAEDLGRMAVLVGFALVGGRGLQMAASLLATLAFAACFPPLRWPLYWVCLTPMTWLLWHAGLGRRRRSLIPFWFGFSVCWIALPFLQNGFNSNAVAIRLLACALFGAQWVAIAAGLQSTRDLPTLVAAPTAALWAVGCEYLRVRVLGWPLLVLGFPAASTPVAQWAYYVGPFGISWLLYTINFLWLPIRRTGDRPVVSLMSPVTAALCLSSAWIGGIAIRSRVPSLPPPVCPLLVQPNRVVSDLRLLNQLTSQALAEDADVDLIIWPEAVARFRTAQVDSLPIPNYRVPCMFGADIEAKDGRVYDSACLVADGRWIGRYDKRNLVIFVEGLPSWLQDDWVRGAVLPSFGVSAPYTAGTDYHTFTLCGARGRSIKLGVSLCYEMHLPWLPQYSAHHRADAIVHLNNEHEDRKSGHRFQPWHGTWACQYRAIETRTWQFVCATWAHSALIDPRGAIRSLLPAETGVVRLPKSDGLSRHASGRDHPLSTTHCGSYMMSQSSGQ